MTPAKTPPVAESVEPVEEIGASWIDIAVLRSREGIIVLDYHPSWSEFIEELHFEDTFATDPPMHLEPGVYRWSGFKVGSWSKWDYINITGGDFISHRLASYEAGRAEGVREAAEVAEGFDDPNRDWLRRSVWDEIKRDTAQRIRALSKEPTK